MNFMVVAIDLTIVLGYLFNKRTDFDQGDEDGGSNEHCTLTSNFDEKNAQSEAERAFDSHTLALVKQLLN